MSEDWKKVDWRNTSEDEDTESIINYYIKHNILKDPKDYEKGSSLTTIWFDSLTDNEKKYYWNKVGDEWGKRFLPQNYMNESSEVEFIDKVNKKLEDKKVKDYIEDLETQPQELKTNIPSNPFMVPDDDDLELDELTSKQNMMFKDYLDRKGWSFNDWWKYEGEERIREHIIDISVDGDIDYKNELKFWDNYFTENMEILRETLIEEGCSLYRRIYIPMMVRKGGMNRLKKWEQDYFLDGISKGYWDKNGNHIGNNSNPYVKDNQNRIIEI